MKRTRTALYPTYVIDGVQMDSSPAQMLEDCMPAGEKPVPMLAEDEEIPPVVDETIDPVPGVTKYDISLIQNYLDSISCLTENRKEARRPYPASYTKRKIAEALISALWRKGHFSLDDLEVRLAWMWDCSPLGNMASFYHSAEAAAQYLFDLSVKLRSFDFTDTEGNTMLSVAVSADGRAEKEEEDDEYAFLHAEVEEEKTLNYCWISDELKCPDVTDAENPGDWLIYIPFDTCDFRLGDSLLEKVAGSCGDAAPEIQDPDYFMDCYEIVREFVEDGVVVAGRTVGDGGLAWAVTRMCGDADIDISAIESAYSEKNIIRILFGETPGVLVRIRDDDYDYVDSQMLLQDIAYYPIGHPGKTSGGLNVMHGRKPGVSSILEALIQGQTTEGED